MPGLDGTGPLGQGSQTGRRQGRCTGKQSENLSTETPSKRGFRFRFESRNSESCRENHRLKKGRGNKMGRQNKFNQ